MKRIVRHHGKKGLKLSEDVNKGGELADSQAGALNLRTQHTTPEGKEDPHCSLPTSLPESGCC